MKTNLIFLALILLSLLFISCADERTEIVAHRGASHDAPENTLAAFELAWKQNTDAIEGDFFLTGDNQIVCIHDKTTERLADKNLVVAESTLEELKKLDVGSWKDPKWQGEKIPTIEEVFLTVPENKKIFIEIKCGPEIVPYLKSALQSSELAPEQTIVISFDKDVIKQVKENIIDIKAFWLTGFRKDPDSGDWSPSLDTILHTLGNIDADGLDCRAGEVVDRDFVSSIKEAGMEMHVWTVDDPEEAKRLRDIGVQSITTNRPGWLKEQLN